MGLLTAAAGVFLMWYPFATATVTTFVLAWTFLLVGVTQLVFAFSSQRAGQFFWKLLSAVVYGAAGIALTVMPFHGVMALTALVGGVFVAQSILQFIVAFQLRPVSGWGWILFDGLVSLALGLVILIQWPGSSGWAIGTLVGASVFVSGITRAIVAGSIRSDVNRVEKLAHGNA